MELGLFTFAETTPDPATGRTIGAAERPRDLLEETELADQGGRDVFGVGEHHPTASSRWSGAVEVATMEST